MLFHSSLTGYIFEGDKGTEDEKDSGQSGEDT
jgi:hypothetical protein